MELILDSGSDDDDIRNNSMWFYKNHKISKDGKFIAGIEDNDLLLIRLCDKTKEPGWAIPHVLKCAIKLYADEIVIASIEVAKNMRNQGIAKGCFSFIKDELMENRTKITGMINSLDQDINNNTLVNIYLNLGCYVTTIHKKNKNGKVTTDATFEYRVQ